MKFMNTAIYERKYRDEAGEDGDKGGGNDDVIADLKSQIESMQAKNNELLGEKKREATKRREAEEAASAKSKEKALAEENYKQLFESSEKEREKVNTELSDLRNGIAKEKRGNAAMKIASGLAEGANAELLAEFVMKRLKYTDNALKVTDEKGDLTISSLSDLEKEIQNDVRYSALLKGSQSSGGGAGGGKNGGGAAKEMTRNDFDLLSNADRMAYAKSGGKITD